MTDASIKAEQARQVLENPVFLETFDEILEQLVDAIADSPIDEPEIRNQLGLQIGALREYKSLLIEKIESGKLEADD